MKIVLNWDQEENLLCICASKGTIYTYSWILLLLRYLLFIRVLSWTEEMQSDRHFWVHFRMCQSPKVTHEVWQTSTIFYLYVELKMLQDAFLQEKIAATQGAVVQALWVLPVDVSGEDILLYRLEKAQSSQERVMGKFPLTSWSFHGHCDTLRCIVCLALVCLRNENRCLPAIPFASKCGLRKCGEKEEYRVCAIVSGFFYSLFVKNCGKN